MLINNLIYREMYNFGYQGRQNPYEFWMRKKLEIIDYLKVNKKYLLEDKYHMLAFEAKLRWRSPIGRLLSFEIQKRLSKYTYDTLENVAEIKVKYGKDYYSIADFNKLHPIEDGKDELGVDLRGISIIHIDMDSIIFEGVDFTYSSINSSLIEKVTFKNCCLDYMSINRSEIRECSFDYMSSFKHVDLKDSLVKSEFNCKISGVIFSPLDNRAIRHILLGFASRWRIYTEVESISFIENCLDKELVKKIVKTNQKLIEIRSIRDGSIIYRIISFFRYIR